MPPAFERILARRLWALVGATFAVAAAEGALALAHGDRQGLVDAADWGYAILVYGLAAGAIGRGPRAERASTLAIAAVFALGGSHALVILGQAIAHPEPPAHPLGLASVAGAVASAAGLALLAPFRAQAAPLARASWVGARNDALSTILGTGLYALAALAPSRWPEYALDLALAALAFQAAYATARAAAPGRESPEAAPGPSARA